MGVDPNVKHVCDTLERIAKEFNTAIIEASKNIRWGLEGQKRNNNRRRNNRPRREPDG